jgi:hypothetical protein
VHFDPGVVAANANCPTENAAITTKPGIKYFFFINSPNPIINVVFASFTSPRVATG